MKVLLTGANGHLGANTIRELLKRGHDVVAFVRPTADRRGLAGLQVSYAEGDVTDSKALICAAEGCDVIIHSAILFAYWAKDPALIERPALEGAKNAVAAAKAVGAKRLIYTSSSWAIGLSDAPDKIRTAADWNERPHSPYARAKTFSERLAWEEADKAGVPMIALCPGAIFGPHDYRMTPSNRMLLGMADGSGQTLNSGLAFADARDAGAIHALAVDHGEPGKRYAVTQYLHFKEVGAHVTAITRKAVKHFGGPKAVAHLLGGMMELGARFTGKEPTLTRAIVDDAAERYMYIDGTPTWQTFNYTPYSPREMMQASLEWYVQMGWLKPDKLWVNHK
jgi:dihydroflavonol-4-reductase